MIIRMAEETDIDTILEFGLKFVEEFSTYFPIPVYTEDVRVTCLGLILSLDGCIAIAEHENKTIMGLLALVAQPVFYNLNRKYVQELLFYVLPEYRKYNCGYKLLNYGEEWAKETGAYGIGFGSLPETSMDGFYQALGYIEQETHFSKVF